MLTCSVVGGHNEPSFIESYRGMKVGGPAEREKEWLRKQGFPSTLRSEGENNPASLVGLEPPDLIKQ